MIALTLAMSSCNPKPKAIDYGSDICHFCKMTIVDSQHAAELVSQKGKVFKFDAIECLLHFKKENTETSFALELVNTYDEPKELLPAAESFYLISKAIPSPMGAYLTAFKNEKSAKEIQKSKDGKLFLWQGLKQHFETDGFNKIADQEAEK